MVPMSEPSPLDEPLLSSDQTVWILVSFAWFGFGILGLSVGQTVFGAAWLLLGVGSVYRVFRPG